MHFTITNIIQKKRSFFQQMFRLTKALAKSTGKKNFSTLVLAEHNNTKVADSTYSTLRAAVELKEKVSIYPCFQYN